MISTNTKSGLNCVWSGFVIEKEDGLYSYEGDCHHSEGDYPLGIYNCVEEDRGRTQSSSTAAF